MDTQWNTLWYSPIERVTPSRSNRQSPIAIRPDGAGLDDHSSISSREKRCPVRRRTSFGLPCHTTNLTTASIFVRAKLHVARLGVDLHTSFPFSTMATPTTTKPVQVFRLRGLSASVFANRAKDKDREVPYFKVSLQRTYRDGKDFKTTTSLSRDDLPIADLLLKRAWAFILEAEEKQKKNVSNVSEGKEDE
ncbi:MAG: hypothetical protein GY854_31415 [Deltaproteobacteria bacterium]|nr:hypothetical protein [Deltaproteobacteria bacterium]